MQPEPPGQRTFTDQGEVLVREKPSIVPAGDGFRVGNIVRRGQVQVHPRGCLCDHHRENPIASTYTAVKNLIEHRILETGSRLNILEAGCGRKWPFQKRDNTITGVDVDARTLAIRKVNIGDLDVAIHGDLRSVRLSPASFDVIYCSFVLEHLAGAEDVLSRFVSWLKPGGRLVLMFSDRDTVSGFYTRITPFWCHVLYRRYVERIPYAGKPGHAPYPTQYDPITSRANFLRFAALNNLLVLDEYSFGSMPGSKAFCRVVSALTFGRLGTHKNLCYVLRKIKIV